MTASRLLWIEFRRNAGIWFVLPIVALTWYLLDSSRGWIPFLWSETNDLLQGMMVPLPVRRWPGWPPGWRDATDVAAWMICWKRRRVRS
jgi:hypothetical protein